MITVFKMSRQFPAVSMKLELDNIYLYIIITFDGSWKYQINPACTESVSLHNVGHCTEFGRYTKEKEEGRRVMIAMPCTY